MAEHIVNHVTSQTRRDYVSFRGKNKICLIPKYTCGKDREKHVACLEIIMEDWEDDITPFKKEIEDMRDQLNSLLTYDHQMGGKIRLLWNRLKRHVRRVDEYKVTGGYKLICVSLTFSFSFLVLNQNHVFCKTILSQS